MGPRLGNEKRAHSLITTDSLAIPSPVVSVVVVVVERVLASTNLGDPTLIM